MLWSGQHEQATGCGSGSSGCNAASEPALPVLQAPRDAQRSGPRPQGVRWYCARSKSCLTPPNCASALALSCGRSGPAGGQRSRAAAGRHQRGCGGRRSNCCWAERYSFPMPTKRPAGVTTPRMGRSDAHGERVRARHVLFAVTPGVDVNALRRRAEVCPLEGRNTTPKEPVDDDVLTRAASANSNCPSGENVGQLDWVRREDCAPECARELFGHTYCSRLRKREAAIQLASVEGPLL